VVLTAHDYKLVCPSYMMLDHGRICEKCVDGAYFHCFTTRCHKENRAASAVYTAETYFNAWFGKYDSVRMFICPSRFMMSKIAHRFPENRLLVLDNPVDVSTYAPSSRDEGYYLFTGRLSKEKGVTTLIKAISEMSLPLKIAGTGPLEEECRSLAKGAPHIQLVGYQTGKALEDLYQGAHACVVPSEWYENAPMSIIEPLAYGKPVIAAGLGGIPELVREGQSGLLFKPFDPGDLKEKVMEMGRLSPEAYGSMCRKARESAEEQFSLERHYDHLLKIYQQVLQPPSHS
jgi:glycosyltransferase involved in cell wall biosynthesis